VQIDVCFPIPGKLTDRDLANALKVRGETLRAEALDIIRAEGAFALAATMLSLPNQFERKLKKCDLG